MERVTALPRGMQLMLGGGVLLLIDLFLKWQDYTASIGGLTVSASRSGWHGWGVIVGLLSILLLVWIVARLAAMEIRLPVSDTLAGAALGALILLFTIIKFFADSDFRTTWAWIGLVLAALIAAGAWLQVMAGGGMDTLRTEASGLTTRPGAPTPPPSAPPPPERPPPPPADEGPPPGGGQP
jgi:hypothetical protein